MKFEILLNLHLACHFNARAKGIQTLETAYHALFEKNFPISFISPSSSVFLSPKQWFDSYAVPGSRAKVWCTSSQPNAHLERNLSAFAGGGPQWWILTSIPNSSISNSSISNSSISNSSIPNSSILNSSSISNSSLLKIWKSSWNLLDEEQDNKWVKKWDVKYKLEGEEKEEIINPLGGSSQDISETKEELRVVLSDIAKFASKQQIDNFANTFREALSFLDNPFPDTIGQWPGSTEHARQLLRASMCSSSVFGGMGSWNDQGFTTKEEIEEYSRLSNSLFLCSEKGLQVSINSTALE